MLAIMPHILIVLLHLFSRLLILLLKPNGAKALLAENLLLRQQLLLLRRSRCRSPNLRPFDRLFFGLASLCLQPRRLARAALIVRPSTLLRCHRALTRLKLHWLYSSAANYGAIRTAHRHESNGVIERESILPIASCSYPLSWDNLFQEANPRFARFASPLLGEVTP